MHKPDYWKASVIPCSTSLSSLTKHQSLSCIFLPKCQYFLSIYSIAVRIIVSPLDCCNKTPNNQFYSTFIYSITAFYNVNQIESQPPTFVFTCSTESIQKCTQFLKSIICFSAITLAEVVISQFPTSSSATTGKKEISLKIKNNNNNGKYLLNIYYMPSIAVA